jgi:hypothetical protein
MQRWMVLSLCLALTACYADPFDNPNDWSETGATGRNIAVQAANPSDLISGKSNPYSNGAAASAGIDKALGGAAGVLAPPAQTAMSITGS